MTLTRADGSAYTLFVMYQEERGDGFLEIRCQAEQQNDDGTSHRFASVEQDLQFQDDNRRFTHGTITLIDADGSKRPLKITAAGPTGFHLGTAGYYGWNDWVYGQWVGDLKVEGNHVTDCDKPENARQLHQLRDLLVRVEDPVGGALASAMRRPSRWAPSPSEASPRRTHSSKFGRSRSVRGIAPGQRAGNETGEGRL
jgi:hypothetical protein